MRMEVMGPAKNAELVSGNNGGKDKYKSYLRQTKAT